MKKLNTNKANNESKKGANNKSKKEEFNKLSLIESFKKAIDNLCFYINKNIGTLKKTNYLKTIKELLSLISALNQYEKLIMQNQKLNTTIESNLTKEDIAIINYFNNKIKK